MIQSPTVAVFGASGKIGRHTLRILAQRGCPVRALVHRTPVEGATCISGDIVNAGAVEEVVRGADIVLQLATTKEDASTFFDVSIRGTVVRDATQCIEVGYGSPAVEVFDSFVTGCGVGLRWGDEYEWDALGTLHVERTIALHNTQNVTTNDPQQGDAPAGAVQILCSAVATPAWDAVEGNVADAPALIDGCPPSIVACESEIGPSSCR